MEYRELPRGDARERFSVLGLGLGGVHVSPNDEIEAIVRKAMANGINYFDVCASDKRVYAPVGNAIRENRSEAFIQVHFGATYDDKGAYGWSRDADKIRETFEMEMAELGIESVDMGFLHCIDDGADYEAMRANGIVDYVKTLKRQGRVRRIGFSSHSPELANTILDSGIADMMMFSINPAYDYEKGEGDDELAIGSVSERSRLYSRCVEEGVGISVMKPFYAGKILDADVSPFGVALTRYQCIQYALDRPGVLTVLPGVRNMGDLDALLGFAEASAEEKAYGILGGISPEAVRGVCVYCNHCQPCPAGINIGLANKYYDLARAGDAMAANHYGKLSVTAEACTACGHCDSRCPFSVEQSSRMTEIAGYFGK